MKQTNPLNEKQFNRLTSSIEWSERCMDFPRRKRVESVRQFVGYHYFTGGAEKRVITPFLKMAVNIYVRALAARAPRVLFTARKPEYSPVAANLTSAVNEIPKEINLEGTLCRVVTEALFSMGIVRVGLHSVGKILGHEYGASFVDVVTLDDYFVDMSAKHSDNIQYCGNGYWLDYEEVMESGKFKKNKINGLRPDEYTSQGEYGQQRAESVSVDESPTTFKDRVWLRDVWLPDERLLVTYAVKNKRLLNVIDWEGPERGPYSTLGFDDVPGNLLPLAPVSVWREIHELANSLFRKLGNQADSEKTVLGFTGGDEEGVKNFQRASDGDGILYGSQPPQKLTAGGVNSTTLAFYMQCRDLFSYFGGNLDSLGGLAPQSETLGQDKLISEASSAQLRQMSAKVVNFTKDVFTALAYYEWNDPVKTRTLKRQIPGTDLAIYVPWNRREKKGSFDDYILSIDVYSMQDDSPGTKMQKLMMLMQNFVMPMMPAIEQAGGILDVQKLLGLAAKYSDFEELGEIVQFQDQITQTNTGPAGMPPNTTRTYERVNRPGATDRGKSQILQQALLGGRPQEDEAASLGRQSS